MANSKPKITSKFFAHPVPHLKQIAPIPVPDEEPEVIPRTPDSDDLQDLTEPAGNLPLPAMKLVPQTQPTSFDELTRVELYRSPGDYRVIEEKSRMLCLDDFFFPNKKFFKRNAIKFEIHAKILFDDLSIFETEESFGSQDGSEFVPTVRSELKEIAELKKRKVEKQK